VLAGTPVNLVVAGPGENPVRVPPLKGLGRDSAVRALEESGLAVGKTRDRETDENPPGTVLGQDPEPGVLLARGCPIDLLVAKAEPLVEAPRLVGRPLEEVQKELSSWTAIFAAFKLGDIVYRASGEPPGTIIDQNPGPGTRISRGIAIDVVVAESRRATDSRGVTESRGVTDSRGVIVPALVGMNLRSANKVLEEFRGQLRLGRRHRHQDRPDRALHHRQHEA